MKPVKTITLVDEKDFTVEAEITADRVLLIKMADGKVEHVGLDFDQLEEIARAMQDIKNKVVYYEKPLRGFTMMWGEPVDIIGEQQVEHEGKILEQYIYNKIGVTPMNGQPFVALKENLILD